MSKPVPMDAFHCEGCGGAGGFTIPEHTTGPPCTGWGDCAACHGIGVVFRVREIKVCEHEWGYSSITDRSACMRCGLDRKDACEHRWMSTTMSDTWSCFLCGVPRRTMNTTYRTAVISFSPDLTDPNGQALPLASLVIANTAETLVAVAVCWTHALHVDKMTKLILGDLPGYLQTQVDSLFESDEEDPDIGDLMHKLGDTLQNSLHVSSISESLILAEEKDIPLTQALTRIGLNQIYTSLEKLDLHPKLDLGLLQVNAEKLGELFGGEFEAQQGSSHRAWIPSRRDHSEASQH